MYSMNLNVNSIFKAATHSTDLTVMQHNSAYTACLDLLSLSWPDHGFATKCSNLNIFQSCHSRVGAVWVAFTRNMQWLWAHLWIQTKQNELIFTQVPLLIHPTLMNTIQTLSKSHIYQKIMQCTTSPIPRQASISLSLLEGIGILTTRKTKYYKNAHMTGVSVVGLSITTKRNYYKTAST